MGKANSFDISDYKFQDLKGPPLNPGTSTYKFEEISKITPVEAEKLEKLIRVERQLAEKSNFKVAPIVREHRGMIRQEETERETQIQNEVERRLLAKEEEAYRKGFERGQADGRDEVFRETQAATDEKLQSLSEMITDVLRVKADLLKEERAQVYETIKTLTKWIIIRELKDDGDYVQRLLEKLILEMQTKSNLLIHVNQSSFESMPEVLDQIQKRIGNLTNVRVEVDHEGDYPGIVLQSENGILNGRLGVQFKNLDKLFSNVGLPYSDSTELDIATEEESDVDFKSSEEIVDAQETNVNESDENLDNFNFDKEDKDDEEKDE